MPREVRNVILWFFGENGERGKEMRKSIQTRASGGVGMAEKGSPEVGSSFHPGY